MSPGLLVSHNGGTGDLVCEVSLTQQRVEQSKVNKSIVVHLGDVLREPVKRY